MSKVLLGRRKAMSCVASVTVSEEIEAQDLFHSKWNGAPDDQVHSGVITRTVLDLAYDELEEQSNEIAMSMSILSMIWYTIMVYRIITNDMVHYNSVLYS
jgi:hypothetical protein